MFISDIVSGVNAKLAGETLTYNQMRLFLEETIDDINTALCSKFPDLTGLTVADDYNFFPNKYIRSVLIVGAAYKFYITDEEGTITAMQYSYDYKDRLFFMKRDYSCLVPEIYQDYNQGYVTGPAAETLVTTDPYDYFGW